MYKPFTNWNFEKVEGTKRDILLTHKSMNISFTFTENYYTWGFLNEDFLQSKFKNRLSDLDIIQAIKFLNRGIL